MSLKPKKTIPSGDVSKQKPKASRRSSSLKILKPDPLSSFSYSDSHSTIGISASSSSSKKDAANNAPSQVKKLPINKKDNVGSQKTQQASSKKSSSATRLGNGKPTNGTVSSSKIEKINAAITKDSGGKKSSSNNQQKIKSSAINKNTKADVPSKRSSFKENGGKKANEKPIKAPKSSKESSLSTSRAAKKKGVRDSESPKSSISKKSQAKASKKIEKK